MHFAGLVRRHAAVGEDQAGHVVGKPELRLKAEGGTRIAGGLAAGCHEDGSFCRARTASRGMQ